MNYGGVAAQVGRRPAKDRPHNQPTEDEAVELSESVFSRICGVDTSIRGFGPDPANWGLQKEALWVGGADGRIGIRGIILGMLLLWRQKGGGVIQDADLKIDRHDVPEVKRVANICVGQGPLPRYNFANTERDVVIAFARKTFMYVVDGEDPPNDASLDALYKDLIASQPTRPRDVYIFFKQRTWPTGRSYLFEKEQEKQVDRKRGAHCIDERFALYLRPDGSMHDAANPDEHIQVAAQLIEKLRGKKREPVILYGPVNSGKSGVIVEILRKMEQDCAGHNSIGLVAKDGSGEPEPVVVINVRRDSQYEVAIRVLAALYRGVGRPQDRGDVRKFAHRLRQEFDAAGRGTMPRLQKEIEKTLKALRRSPPDVRGGLVFIFTGWDEWGATTPRGLLRDIPNVALVILLQRYKCRVLVSTVGDMTDDTLEVFRTQFAPTRKGKHLRLGHPMPSHIRRYWPHMRLSEAESKVVDQLPSDRRLPGSHLLLIATALQFCQVVQGAESCLDAAVTQAVTDYARAIRKLNPEDDVPDTNVADIFNAILQKLHDQGGLRAFLTIAISDDGLRPHSVNQLGDPWADAPGKSNSQLDRVLSKLHSLAENFFLPRVAPALEVPGQFTGFEVQPDVGGQAEVLRAGIAAQTQYELNQTLREILINLITDGPNPPAKKYWPELRAAAQAVAAIARRRSRNWRLHEPLSCLTRDYRFMLADIQCYEAILAGLDIEVLSDKAACDKARADAQPFDVTCTAVHCDEIPCDDVHKLRYAVIDLLMGELDGPQHNLTMRYDVDGLRARLYLSVFTAVSRREFRVVRDLKQADLPQKLPEYAYNAFEFRELLRIIEAIALSAFHHQCPDIVQWCYAREAEILGRVPDEERAKLCASSSRILCAAANMSMLLGRPITERDHEDEAGLLEVVRSRLSAEVLARYPEMEAWFEDNASQTLPAGHRQPQREWLRLKAREAELADMVGARDDAVILYLRLREIDGALARATPDRSGLGVLSGRPGRTMAITLAAAAADPKITKEESFRLKKIVQGILDGEIARLSRFGGAERIAIAIARGEVRRILAGKLEPRVLNIAREARAAVDEERVSLRTRLLALDFFLRCEIEAPPDDRYSIDLLLRDAKLYSSMARALEFRPQENAANAALAKLLR